MPAQVDIVFVILHYNAIEETLECVESIRNTHKGKSYQIVIVDNHSPNDTGAELQQRYAQDSDVTMLINDANLGFARGNNVGFSYAKSHFAPQYIVLLNNDTLVLQDDFLERVKEEYSKSGFAVLGPVIETPGHFNNTNPIAYKEKTLGYCYYFYAKCAAYYFLNMIRCGGLVEAFKRKFLHKPVTGDGSIHPTHEEGVKIHGCFMIFSREYIDRFNGLHDGTFLYLEEDLLYHRLNHAGLKSVYTPDIRIYHKEDASTNTMVKKGAAKEMFFYKNHLKSTRVLIKQLIQDRK